MTRSARVYRICPDSQPSQRLRDLSPTYRVASEILVGAADLGCSGDLYDFIWSICQREADAYHASIGEGQAT